MSSTTEMITQTDSSVVIELIRIVPSLAWIAVIVFVLVKLYPDIKDRLLSRIANFKLLGAELSFFEISFDKALRLAQDPTLRGFEVAEKHPDWRVEIPEKDKKKAVERVRHNLDVFHKALVLWVDDMPINNCNERKMLRQLDMEVHIAKTSEAALAMIEEECYEVIISDMDRPQESVADEGEAVPAGLQFLKRLHSTQPDIPVIFYIGNYNPALGVPEHAFGITNRPDRLLHLLIDALPKSLAS